MQRVGILILSSGESPAALAFEREPSRHGQVDALVLSRIRHSFSGTAFANSRTIMKRAGSRSWGWVARACLLVGVAALASPVWAKKRTQASPRLRLRHRAAAIDLGSNSVKLVVTNRRGKVVFDRKISSALGQGIGGDKLLPAANQKRVIKAVNRLVKDARRRSVEPGRIKLGATAAVRNATGSDAGNGKLGRDKLSGKSFLKQLAGTFGIGETMVLSGRAEAELGFRGAMLAWPSKRLEAVIGGAVKKVAVFDTGGGSHQVTVGTLSGGPVAVTVAGSSQFGSHMVRDAVMGGKVSASSAELALADRKLATVVKKLPIDGAKLRGAQPILTGGFAKFLRVYFGRDKVTVSDIRKLRDELAPLDPERRRRHIKKRLHKNQRDPRPETQLGLSAKEFSRQAAALGFSGRGKSGKSLPAKATLLLRVFDLAGYKADQGLLISGTDVRHALLNE